jgi:hypothetical protein
MKACHRERGAAGVVFDRDRYIDGIGVVRNRNFALQHANRDLQLRSYLSTRISVEASKANSARVQVHRSSHVATNAFCLR